MRGRKHYRPWNPFHPYLLPPSPQEWLPPGHLAYFVLDTVQSLNLSTIDSVIQGKAPQGSRPYSPRMMVALLLYGYCVGIFSSRKLSKATYEDVAFRVVAGGQHPYFTNINQFRLDHREALAGLFLQVLRLCQKAGLIKLGHVSLDGSKIPANASNHKAMSYERMQKEEPRLQAEIALMLERADAADQEDDRRCGMGNDAHDLPEELHRREARLARIQEAKAALEREAALTRSEALRERAEAQRVRAADEKVAPGERNQAAKRAERSERKAKKIDPRDGHELTPSGPAVELPKHRVPATPDGTPASRAQRNFTDPDSRIMKKAGGYLQGYNVQIVVDAESQVIVAEAVTNQAPDQEHLEPLLNRIEENCGEAPRALSADSGYFSERNVKTCEARGIDPYIAVGREGKGKDISRVEPSTGAQAVRRRMQERFALSRQRIQIITFTPSA